MPRPVLHKVVAMPSSSFWEGTTGSDTSLTISANLVETLNAWLQRNSRVLGALAAVLGADDFLESFNLGAQAIPSEPETGLRLQRTRSDGQAFKPERFGAASRRLTRPESGCRRENAFQEA